ncbi:MAG: hypothetical protein ABI321_19380 [Polyangia bacterium]
MLRARTALLSFTLGVVAVFAVSGCNTEAKQKEQATAENARVEARAKELAQQMTRDIEAKQKADQIAAAAATDKAERDRLAKAPQEMFEASGVQMASTAKSHVQGIASVTLTNKSKHLVSGIRAKLDFMKDGDVEVSLPLQMSGALPAGATKTFSMTDHTLTASAVQTSASETRVTVTAAHAED